MKLLIRVLLIESHRTIVVSVAPLTTTKLSVIRALFRYLYSMFAYNCLLLLITPTSPQAAHPVEVRLSSTSRLFRKIRIIHLSQMLHFLSCGYQQEDDVGHLKKISSSVLPKVNS